MCLIQLKLLSIEITFFTPLEENSKLILPVPENKSRTSIELKSILLLRILNRPSLALLVVGLTGRFIKARK